MNLNNAGRQEETQTNFEEGASDQQEDEAAKKRSEGVGKDEGAPQNPNVGGGRTTDRATEKKDDPCAGVKSSDLIYDRVQRYRNNNLASRGRYVYQTAEQHIRSRHMNPASPASQYYGSFHAVQNTNAYTFDFGTRTTNTTVTNIYFELNFHLPIVGTDRDEHFSPTGYNTLILYDDCRHVRTSHPGRAWN